MKLNVILHGLVYIAYSALHVAGVVVMMLKAKKLFTKSEGKFNVRIAACLVLAIYLLMTALVDALRVFQVMRIIPPILIGDGPLTAVILGLSLGYSVLIISLWYDSRHRLFSSEKTGRDIHDNSKLILRIFWTYTVLISGLSAVLLALRMYDYVNLIRVLSLMPIYVLQYTVGIQTIRAINTVLKRREESVAKGTVKISVAVEEFFIMEKFLIKMCLWIITWVFIWMSLTFPIATRHSEEGLDATVTTVLLYAAFRTGPELYTFAHLAYVICRRQVSSSKRRASLISSTKLSGTKPSRYANPGNKVIPTAEESKR